MKEGAGTRHGKPPPGAVMRGAGTQQAGRGGTRHGKPPKRLFAKRSAPYRDEAPFCEAKWRGEPTRGAKRSNVARSGVCPGGERAPLAGRLPHPRAWRGFAVAGASSVAPPAVPCPRLVQSNRKVSLREGGGGLWLNCLFGHTRGKVHRAFLH